MTKKSKCITCFSKLHKGWNFPEDFPEEWKMCCHCKVLADLIISHGLKRVINAFTVLERKSLLKRIERVNKLINVN